MINMKNSLLNKIILFENLILLMLSTVSTILFLCGVSVGYLIFMISSYVLYPLILLSFGVGFLLKVIEIKESKLDFILFGANLAISFVCLLAMLTELAGALEAF